MSCPLVWTAPRRVGRRSSCRSRPASSDPLGYRGAPPPPTLWPPPCPSAPLWPSMALRSLATVPPTPTPTSPTSPSLLASASSPPPSPFLFPYPPSHTSSSRVHTAHNSTPFRQPPSRNGRLAPCIGDRAEPAA